ncbi:class II aldolase/adducin family protein [Sphingomonas sp. HH69]|uniref:class II aldolase/adducin family protein n=1 Tax=Sphingobium TaxID=165695 RepID=UPI002413767E|nr:class II aldolase/adducin family protein [Sphingobium sp. LB126]
MASRAMARHGLAHAYGHVSLRLDNARFLVSPARPLIAVSRDDPGVVVTLNGDLPQEALPEVRIHREIYRRRPSIGGIVRVQPPAIMALSALGRTPGVHHGLGTYFAPAAPLWSGVDLVRDDDSAVRLAVALGDAAAIVLRGNGCVCAAESLPDAASLAFFLEDAARLDLAILSTSLSSSALQYSPEESARRAVRAGALFERMWQFLCTGDPEWQ